MGLDYEELRDDKIVRRVFNINGFLVITIIEGPITYECLNFRQDALDSDPDWRISRTTVSSFRTQIERANNGRFINSIDDRNTIFPIPPFINNFSAQFDGVNDYIETLHDPLIDFDRLDKFSIHGRFKSTDTGSFTIIEKMNGNTGYRISKLGTEKAVFEFRATGTGDRIKVQLSDSNPTFLDGLWHSFLVTYDGSSNASGARIYIDGVLITVDIQNDTLTGSPSNTSNMSISARTGGGDYYKGKMEEVAIFNDELSASDAVTLHNNNFAYDIQNNNGLIGSSNVFHQRFGDGPNDDPINLTLEDVKSGLTGTMNNMTEGDIETEVPSG